MKGKLYLPCLIKNYFSIISADLEGSMLVFEQLRYSKAMKDKSYLKMNQYPRTVVMD